MSSRRTDSPARLTAAGRRTDSPARLAAPGRRADSPARMTAAHGAAQQGPQAAVFAALGDETRLLLLVRLAGGRPQSISQLTAGSRLTRQAVTKHLRVLQRARLVHSTRAGRENLFALDPQPLQELKQFLDRVSASWDQALHRLKQMVEGEGIRPAETDVGR